MNCLISTSPWKNKSRYRKQPVKPRQRKSSRSGKPPALFVINSAAPKPFARPHRPSPSQELPCAILLHGAQWRRQGRWRQANAMGEWMTRSHPRRFKRPATMKPDRKPFHPRSKRSCLSRLRPWQLPCHPSSLGASRCSRPKFRGI